MKYIHLTIRNALIVFIMALGVSSTANAHCCWPKPPHKPPVVQKGSVNGLVFEDTNGNGHKDANEHTKSGVQVKICFTPKSVTSTNGIWWCGQWKPTCKHHMFVPHWKHTGCCTGFMCPGKPETTTPQPYCVTKTTDNNGHYSVANAPVGGVTITLIESTLPAGSHLTTHNNPFTATLNAGGDVGTNFGYDVAKIESIEDASAKEGELLIHRVRFSQRTSSSKTYNLRIIDGSAHAGEDFEAIPTFDLNVITYNANTHKITVPADVTRFNIYIKSKEDKNYDEGNEHYTIELEDLTATGTILDTVLPTVVLSEASAEEGHMLVHNATATESSEDLEYNFGIASDSATLGLDFNSTPVFTNGVTYVKESSANGADIGKITVPAGVTNFEMKIQAYDDNISEGEEKYITSINYTNAVKWVYGTIIDATEPAVLSVGNAHNTEGLSLVHQVKIIATKTLKEYTLSIEDDTAKAGEDYVAIPTFPNQTGITYNSATKKLYVEANISDFNVSILSKTDKKVEDNETYTITVGLDGSSKTGTGTIEDATDGEVKITPASATEGSPLVHNVEVTSSNKAVTYDLAIVGTGTAPATKDVDYNSELNCSAGVTYDKFHNTITVPADTAEFTVTVESKTDDLNEGNETYALTINNDTSTATAIGTIVDGTALPEVISVGSDTKQEGNDLVHKVVVTSSPIAQEYNLSIIDGTAKAGEDFNEPTIEQNIAGVTLTAGVITVPANATHFNVVVHAKTDSVDENNETYTIKVENKNSSKTNTGTITDDTVSEVTSVTSAQSDENDTLTHTVVVTEAITAPATYDFSIEDVNTTAGLDYNNNITSANFTQGVTYNAGKITVPVEVTSFNVSIDALEDNVTDPDERYTLHVGDKNGIGTINDTTVIEDPTVVSIGDSEQEEGLRNVHAVILSDTTTRDTKFTLSFEDINTTDEDYSKTDLTFGQGTSATLGFTYDYLTHILTVPANVKTFEINVRLKPDSEYEEETEAYKINLDDHSARGTIFNVGT